MPGDRQKRFLQYKCVKSISRNDGTFARCQQLQICRFGPAHQPPEEISTGVSPAGLSWLGGDRGGKITPNILPALGPYPGGGVPSCTAPSSSPSSGTAKFSSRGMQKQTTAHGVGESAVGFLANTWYLPRFL